jgi:hypothetical protein
VLYARLASGLASGRGGIMKAIAHFLLGLVLLALDSAAPAQLPGGRAEPVEGLYVVDMMETASALELTPDGRFRWMFTTGALDMTAEGRWRVAEDGAVLLDTEPPVEPPRFEFLGSGREEAPALVVRIVDARGRTPTYLDAEAEYDSGDLGFARLENDAYRFEPEPGLRIVAIRVGSAGFRFWSERYEVPAGANLMRFRFFPGDLGRADFRGERATLDGDTLTLSLMGSPIVYRRLTDEENEAVQAAMAEVAEMVAGAGAEGESEDEPD